MDPISDMFVRIQNGYRAKKTVVILPYSKMKGEIARILEERGYVAGTEKKGRKVRKFLEVKLKYDGSVPALTAVKRISKPSRRLYYASADIKPVRQGFGLLILTTSKGILTGEEAKKTGVGGEAIAEIW